MAHGGPVSGGGGRTGEQVGEIEGRASETQGIVGGPGLPAVVGVVEFSLAETQERCRVRKLREAERRPDLGEEDSARQGVQPQLRVSAAAAVGGLRRHGHELPGSALVHRSCDVSASYETRTDLGVRSGRVCAAVHHRAVGGDHRLRLAETIEGGTGTRDIATVPKGGTIRMVHDSRLAGVATRREHRPARVPRAARRCRSAGRRCRRR